MPRTICPAARFAKESLLTLAKPLGLVAASGRPHVGLRKHLYTALPCIRVAPALNLLPVPRASSRSFTFAHSHTSKVAKPGISGIIAAMVAYAHEGPAPM